MERLTQKVADLAADLKHRIRVRRQLTLIAAYTMKDGPRLRRVPETATSVGEEKKGAA